MAPGNPDPWTKANKIFFRFYKRVSLITNRDIVILIVWCSVREQATLRSKGLKTEEFPVKCKLLLVCSHRSLKNNSVIQLSEDSVQLLKGHLPLASFQLNWDRLIFFSVFLSIWNETGISVSTLHPSNPVTLKEDSSSPSQERVWKWELK